jgi:hypothetical protein
MPHPRYDWLMAYSEELDRHGLLRPPYDVLTDESHEELLCAFAMTLPVPGFDPAITTPTEELDLAAAYAGWLADRGELVAHPILTPSVVAQRLYAKVQAHA